MSAGEQGPGQWRRPLRYPDDGSPPADPRRRLQPEPPQPMRSARWEDSADSDETSAHEPWARSREQWVDMDGGGSDGQDLRSGPRRPATEVSDDDDPSPRSGGDASQAPGRPPARSHAHRRAPGRQASARRTHRDDQNRRGGSFLRELPILVLVAFALALLIKAFLVQAFWIPSQSMEQTLLINDRVLVNKVVYQFRDVHRGEVVVFNGEGTGFESKINVVEEPSNIVSRAVRGAQHLLGLGAPSDKDFIKRVIGVGGDVVACCDDQGRVTVNGYPLDEPYVYPAGVPQQPFGPVTVPEGQLWVMGDHRGDSSDSRNHGPIPEDKVIGKAFVKVWPLSRVGLLRMPGTFGNVSGPAGAAAAIPATGSSPVGAPQVLAGIGLVVVPAALWRRRRVRLARLARPNRSAAGRPARRSGPHSRGARRRAGRRSRR